MSHQLSNNSKRNLLEINGKVKILYKEYIFPSSSNMWVAINSSSDLRLRMAQIIHSIPQSREKGNMDRENESDTVFRYDPFFI